MYYQSLYSGINLESGVNIVNLRKITFELDYALNHYAKLHVLSHNYHVLIRDLLCYFVH